jgi:hypothetical protein
MILIARIVIARIDRRHIPGHRPGGCRILIPPPRRCFAQIGIVNVQVVRFVFA